MPRHYHTETFNDGGANIAYSVTKENEAAIDEEITFGSLATDVLVALVLDVSQISSLCIVADAACTIKTNSSSSPAQTISLTANKPLRWNDGMAHANPLTTDITAIYVSCAANTTLKIKALYDATV